jgi:hypothetical protein
VGYSNPLDGRFGKDFFSTLPSSPGVYFFVGEDGEILYIGKAKRLRARLSSYRRAKPGSAPEHTLEMLELARSIRFEHLATDKSARAREKELIHAVRPPYNIADTYEEHTLCIGVSVSGTRVRFRCTRRSAGQGDFRLYGCYANRAPVKQGYSAWLRLLHAAACASPRFSYPARISRDYPPFEHETRVRAEWALEIDRFLMGRSSRLLVLVVHALLENEKLPRFLYPSIQEDLRLARAFYRYGPRATARFRKTRGIRERVVPQELMDRLIASDVEVENAASPS